MLSGVLSRTPVEGFGPSLAWGQALPEADLALIAVKDGAIGQVVDMLDGTTSSVGVVAHVSGFVPVSALGPLRGAGTAIGGFHPLQTLPDPERGSRALAGSYVGVGGDAQAAELLVGFGESLDMIPFRLEDEHRPAYHAAAAATANFSVTALAVAFDLYGSAGIPPEVSRPLVDRVVANVYEVGPATALTGPIARGDTETVRGHLLAADAVDPGVGRQYRLLAEATAIRAHREGDVDRWT